MGYYEKNKEAMRERYSEIFERIEEEISDDMAVKSVASRDGNAALTVERDGKTFRLNSAYKPLAEAEKWADQYEFQHIGVNVFMFGLGNGIFVRELLRRATADANVYLWEPDAAIFRVAMEEEDLTDLMQDERLHLYLGKEGLQELKEAMEFSIGWHNIPTQIRCKHNCYDVLYEEEYRQFLMAIKYANENVRVKRDTNAHFAHRAVKNIFANLRYIRHSNFVTELIGKIPEDVPAIVVAAGPSLEKNMDLLREAAGRAFIIATDTAVRNLEGRGLPYDCVVTIDPGKPAWYLTDYEGCREKPLFCQSVSQPDILSFHRGRKIWAAGSVYLDNLYNSFGLLFPFSDAGGSVATVGAQLAWQLGLKNIILIGQDLAYTGDHTHAGGYDDHTTNEEKFQEMVDSVDGGQVKSRGDWIVYRNWFEEFIRMNEELNLVDATEGGALIHGAETISFREAIDTYCDGKSLDFAKLLEELPRTFEVVDFDPVREKIQSMEKGVANILRKSREGKKSAEEFLAAGNRISAKKHDRLIKEISKANKYLERQDGYELMDLYTFDLTLSELREVNHLTGDTYTDEVNSVKSALAIYEGFIKAAEELEGQLKETLREV